MATRTINDYFNNEGAGGSGGVMKLNSNGEVSLQDGATQFDDLVGSVAGLKLYTTAGKVDYDFDENALIFQTGGSISVQGDVVSWNVQKEHKIKADSMLRMHIHYTQVDTIERVFTMKYRIQPNGGAKTTAWTTITTTCNATNHVFPYTSGSINQIVQFLDYIDWSVVGISSTVQFQLARTDSLTGDVEVTFLDGHFEADAFGSNSEYVK